MQGYYSPTLNFRHWAFRNNFYFLQEFVLHPELALSQLYTGEVFIEVPKFRTNVFWELVWFPVQDKMCFQVGWNSDPITFLLRTDFNAIECYKTIIKTFTDWSQWRIGFINGKVFDSCKSSVSTNAQLLELYLYNYLRSVDNMITPTIDFSVATTPLIT